MISIPCLTFSLFSALLRTEATIENTSYEPAEKSISWSFDSDTVHLDIFFSNIFDSNPSAKSSSIPSEKPDIPLDGKS
jgi:hypothetical protein